MKQDTTGENVYSWFKTHADGDGTVDTACAHIARTLNQPKRTVQGALQRLQNRGKLVMIAPRRFIVVEVSDPEYYAEFICKNS